MRISRSLTLFVSWDRSITFGLKKNIKHFAIPRALATLMGQALLIDGSPRIELLAIDLNVPAQGEDFIDVEGIAVASVPAFQSTCIPGSEFDTPEAVRFPAYSYASFSEQVFDSPVTGVEKIVQSGNVGDRIGWKSVAPRCCDY